jgi:hypothetical protein
VRRAGLLAAAAAFFVWENVAAALWLRAHGTLAAGLSHAWAALRDDWLVLLVFTDACVFALCALVWLARDLRSGGAAPGRRALWLAAAVVLGSPVLLVYLARRTPAGGVSPSAGSG